MPENTVVVDRKVPDFALPVELSAEARAQLQGSAGVLKQNTTWQVTVEGHCDERGTAEYNLSLGERRALAAKAYLVSLGVAADRLRTVSYGKEFPFDPGHDEGDVVQEPARALRDHRKVESSYEAGAGHLAPVRCWRWRRPPRRSRGVRCR